MKRWLPWLVLSVLAAGCASSRFQNDPRAAAVGPAYLDYIQQYPRDRSTQYYYPSFRMAGFPIPDPASTWVPNPGPNDVQPLLTTRPPEPPEVQAIEGAGWPELERAGMPFFTPAEQALRQH